MGFLSKYSPQILGVVRIVVGLLFLEHGLMKIAGFPAPMGHGPLPPMIMAAGIIELVGGRCSFWACSAASSPLSARAKWRLPISSPTSPGVSTQP